MSTDFWADAEKPSENEFKTIPHNTLCMAVINGVKTKSAYSPNPDNPEPDLFEVEWSIIDGEYVNRKIWQKLDIFSSNPKTRATKKWRLKQLLELNSIPVTAEAPTIFTLLPLQGKILVIKIGVFDKDSKQYNYIQDVFPQDYSGYKLHKDFQEVVEEPFDDEIPF